jgi:hypothetical protein
MELKELVRTKNLKNTPDITDLLRSRIKSHEKDFGLNVLAELELQLKTLVRITTNILQVFPRRP